jgi:hypothetical protein
LWVRQLLNFCDGVTGIEKPPVPEIKESPALSLFARPGDGSISTRKIAILVADGVTGDLKALHDGLAGLTIMNPIQFMEWQFKHRNSWYS